MWEKSVGGESCGRVLLESVGEEGCDVKKSPRSVL